MKGVPVGNDDFKDVRNNNGYYVDKTGLIVDIVAQNSTKAFHQTEKIWKKHEPQHVGCLLQHRL